MGETAWGYGGGDGSRRGYGRRAGFGCGGDGGDARAEGAAYEGGEDWNGGAAEEAAAAGVKTYLGTSGKLASGVDGQRWTCFEGGTGRNGLVVLASRRSWYDLTRTMLLEHCCVWICIKMDHDGMSRWYIEMAYRVFTSGWHMQISRRMAY